MLPASDAATLLSHSSLPLPPHVGVLLASCPYPTLLWLERETFKSSTSPETVVLTNNVTEPAALMASEGKTALWLQLIWCMPIPNFGAHERTDGNLHGAVPPSISEKLFADPDIILGPAQIRRHCTRNPVVCCHGCLPYSLLDGAVSAHAAASANGMPVELRCPPTPFGIDQDLNSLTVFNHLPNPHVVLCVVNDVHSRDPNGGNTSPPDSRPPA
ncbi:hypothetical protein C8R45DRAFT_940666 [Mycena sanguinolenta]|nr:hypothetical protein C8R45DRAFT_940666 [Mycena sanguinolenta]